MLIESASSSSSRSIILFSFGCILAIVLMTFQYEHKLRLFNSPRLILTLPALSLVSICGFGAALVGLLYPTLVDAMHLPFEQNSIGKSQVCKSIVIFVGINHLCAKIPFRSDLHFILTLAFLCIAFWWWLDRSWLTFVFSILISILLTIIIEILLRSGALEYSYSDFYLKTCVPCLTFAGAILTIQMTKLLCSPDEFVSKASKEHLKSQ